MSFPRLSDVSKHLARKPKGAAKLPTPLTDSEQKEVELLTERLFAVVRGNPTISAPGDSQ